MAPERAVPSLTLRRWFTSVYRAMRWLVESSESVRWMVSGQESYPNVYVSYLLYRLCLLHNIVSFYSPEWLVLAKFNPYPTQWPTLTHIVTSMSLFCTYSCEMSKVEFSDQWEQVGCWLHLWCQCDLHLYTWIQTDWFPVQVVSTWRQLEWSTLHVCWSV